MIGVGHYFIFIFLLLYIFLDIPSSDKTRCISRYVYGLFCESTSCC